MSAESKKPDPQLVGRSVHGCARCGGAHINKIDWYRFERPVVDDDEITWTHWATCPTSGDPILMRIA